MPHPIDIHVGQRIRARRTTLKFSQSDLADAVGVKFQQVQKYETGANRVSASRLWDMADKLGVSIAFFFEGLNGAKANDLVANSFCEAEILLSVRKMPPIQRRVLVDVAHAMTGTR